MVSKPQGASTPQRANKPQRANRRNPKGPVLQTNQRSNSKKDKNLENESADTENYDALLKKLLGNSGTPDDISTKNFSDATNHESDESNVDGFEHFQDQSQNDL